MLSIEMTNKFFSPDVLTENGKGKAFRVHDPKNATEKILEVLQNHILEFEKFLKKLKQVKVMN